MFSIVMQRPQVGFKPIYFGLTVLGCGFLLALIWRWLHPTDLKAQRIQPLPQHPLIQVYMNQNPTSSYREPYRPQQRPGDNLEQIIIDQIHNAQSTIDVAVQELRSPLIAQALRERAMKGVRIRVVIENTYNRPWSSVSPSQAEQLNPRMKGRYRENLRLIDRNGDGQLQTDEVNNFDALVVLQRSGIPWKDDTADRSAGSGLMHHKFVVVDGNQVIVTSANFTMSDLHGDFSPQQSLGNPNSLVQIQNSAIAALFTEEFNLLWGNGSGKDSRFGVDKPFRPVQTIAVGDAKVQVKFSPTPTAIPWEFSSNGLISKTLGQGRKQIDLALFVFSSQQIANHLEPIVQKGAALRTLIDPGFAFQYYSEALDLLGVALPARNTPNDPEAPSQTMGAPTGRSNCQTEPENHPWRSPIQTVGVPQLPPGDLLHHKFGIVDQRIVIMGSHNWTEAADKNNDETLLVIEHPTVSAHYEREYERLWANSRLGLPHNLRQGWDMMRTTCLRTTVKTPSPNRASPSTSTHKEKVNLNTAPLEALEQLPGVGPKLAQRIVAARQQQPFRSLADLDRIPGVGKRVLKELGDRVTW